MDSLLYSLLYALQGLWHAISTELNLKVFTVLVLLVLIAGFWFHISIDDWFALLLSSGFFLAIEVINTSIERLSDAFHDHLHESERTHAHHTAMKATKDVAAGASLLAACVWLITVTLVFYPYL